MKEKQRILFVHPFVTGICGPDLSLFALIQNLDLQRYDLYLVVPQRTSVVDKYVQYVQEVIVDPNADSFHQLRSLKSNFQLAIRNAGQFSSIRRLIRRYRINLVHTNIESSWIFGIAARCMKVPAVLHVRGLTIFSNSIRKTIVSAILRMCANEFIAVSGPVARALADCGIQPDRIHPIENAVNINHFSPTETSGQTDLQNRLNKGSPLIGAVGSANPRKGWGTLLLACALLKTNYPHIRCAFIGNLEAGDVPFYGKYTYSSILTSLIKALSLEETTLFAGMQDDIPAIISGWDLLVQPSLTEAGPRAVIEAMSAGLPVVATRVGGNMDYVADGITGLLCNENDPVDLARAISQLIMDPGRREIMGREARRVAVERFSIDVHVKKVEKVYTKLLRTT